MKVDEEEWEKTCNVKKERENLEYLKVDEKDREKTCKEERDNLEYERVDKKDS